MNNIYNLTIDTKKFMIEYVLNNIDVEQSRKDAFFDLYNLCENIISKNIFHDVNISNFNNVINMLHSPFRSKDDTNLKFNQILSFIDFNYIRACFDVLNTYDKITGYNLIDKIIKKEIKIII